MVARGGGHPVLLLLSSDLLPSPLLRLLGYPKYVLPSFLSLQLALRGVGDDLTGLWAKHGPWPGLLVHSDYYI